MPAHPTHHSALLLRDLPSSSVLSYRSGISKGSALPWNLEL